MTKQELQRVCGKAAKVIQASGLCKDGTYGYNNGPKCAIGAMRFVANGNVDLCLEGVGDNDLSDLFKAARPRTKRKDIVDFNDAARTRKHDVVELLRDMAALA